MTHQVEEGTRGQALQPAALANTANLERREYVRTERTIRYTSQAAPPIPRGRKVSESSFALFAPFTVNHREPGSQSAGSQSATHSRWPNWVDFEIACRISPPIVISPS